MNALLVNERLYDRPVGYLVSLLHELCALPGETEWVEFKVDDTDHACLRYVSRRPVTNASVRERFGIDERNAAIASRLLNEAVEAGQVVLEDSEVGTRVRRYIPYWAASPSRGQIA